MPAAGNARTSVVATQVRPCVPPPHVSLQVVQAPQLPTQSTATAAVLSSKLYSYATTAALACVATVLYSCTAV